MLVEKMALLNGWSHPRGESTPKMILENSVVYTGILAVHNACKSVA